MIRFLVVLVFGIFFLGFVDGVSVDNEILDAFEGGNERVRVLIKMQSEDKVHSFFGASNFKMGIFEKMGIGRGKINREIGSYVSAYVDRKDLKELMMNDFIESVSIEATYHTMLQDSVEIMNASAAWTLNINGLNLTGIGQTVCVIDTGVNYSHVDFGGCYGDDNPNSNCTVLGGWDFCGNDGNCSEEDSDPMDVFGHGTHVAGIVAANGGISGVGPETKIVMMKAANSSGVFFVVNIVAAIDWCVANASKFNISVISMSLGGDLYPGYCDSEGNSNILMANSINNAVANGISVVVATGNDGNLTHIGSPACIQNVTRVGAVDKDDNIASYSNRNFITLLFAIGGISVSNSAQVNSTVIGGEYGYKTGTSMATPMVAGAIALINQFLDLTSQTMTPSEIEDVLYSEGLQFTEGLNNFSRIDVYSAILSLDNVAPNVILVSPVDNHVNLSVNQTFVCNATDWQLANVTLKVWNSTGGLYYHEHVNLSGTFNETSFDLVDMPMGGYDWNCFVYDAEGNIGSGSSNFSLTVGGIEISLNSPENNSATNTDLTFFNCSSFSDAAYELINVSFNLWNSSGILVRNETKNISGFENVSIFNWTFEYEDNYLWYCVVLNNNSNVGYGVNFSVSYDVSVPVISDLNEGVSSAGATMSWITSENANSSLWVSGGAWSNSSERTLNHSIIVSGLSALTGYDYIVWSCDLAGNCGNDSGEFTTSVMISHSGGGGGGFAVKSYFIENDELRNGKIKLLKIKDEVSFNLASGRHGLKVKKIGKDFVDIVIESEPVYLTLKIGEEIKLNLSSSNYYDLAVKLNDIRYGKANVSVKRIFEERIFEVLDVAEVEKIVNVAEIEEEVNVAEIEEKFDPWVLFWEVLIMIIVLFFLYVVKKKEIKRGKSFKGKMKNGKGKKIKA